MPMPSRLLYSLVVAGLLAACATPQARIERSPDVFQALSADQQALVKAGQIAIGFSEEAVKLALGEPQRVTQRTDERGKSTIWRYVEYDNSGTDGAFGGFYGAGYYPGLGGFGAYGRPIGFNGGFFGPGLTTIYGVRGRGTENDRIRVVFVDGKVSAIEEEVK